ncbi:MAG TPA: hypothetical protein VK172_10285 [Lentimicrobium sp.]|nr:hypothetical protein [Lentimicrobium sp.]
MSENKIEIKKVLMTYDVPEGHYHYGKPFVYYGKDEKGQSNLYLETVKVVDADIESTLRAVREYKKSELNHQQLYYKLFEKSNNAYDYWLNAFNYQAHGGGLILWSNIQGYWEDELARRGKHTCPKCGTTTVMYYKPFCPNCGEIEVYKGAINLFQLAYKLAYKNGLPNKAEYIDVFQEYCNGFRNDSICTISMPEFKETGKSGEHRKYQRLKEMNAEYPFAIYSFFVSW